MNSVSEVSDSRFLTRKWNIANDQSITNYHVTIEIIYNTEVLKSTVCDYNDAYVLVRGDIKIERNIATRVAFSCAPLINCITEKHTTGKGDVEDLDFPILMYILLEDSLNYSDTTGS